MTNSQIAKLLRNIAASYTIKDEKKFRFQIIAYQRASDAVQNTTTELSELYKEKKLDTIPGIGPTIQSHLEELFKTGKVKHFDWVLKGIPETVFPLLDVPTFGPKKAHKLVAHFKLKKPETIILDIKNLAKAGKIAKLILDGKTYDEIAEKVKTSTSTVSKIGQIIKYGKGELQKVCINKVANGKVSQRR